MHRTSIACAAACYRGSCNAHFTVRRLLRCRPHASIPLGWRTRRVVTTTSVHFSTTCRRADSHTDRGAPPRTTSAEPSGAYEVWEMRGMLLAATHGASTRNPTLARDALQRLPRAAQHQLQQYVSPPQSGARVGGGAGFLAYVRDNLSDTFVIQSACLVPIAAAPVATGAGTDSMDFSATEPKPGLGRSLGGSFRSASATAFAHTAPPPPTPSRSMGVDAQRALQEDPLTQRGGAPADNSPETPRNNVEAIAALVPFIPTFFVAADRVAETLPPALQQLYRGSTFLYYVKRFRYYVDVRIARGGVPEVRLKPGFAHPAAGVADSRFQGTFAGAGSCAFVDGPPTTDNDRDTNADSRGSAPPTVSPKDAPSSRGDATTTRRTGRGFSETVPDGSAFRAPPRHSEAHLIALVLPHIPKNFTALTEVLPEVSDIVTHHPSFNALLGVTGFFCKYPEYFQLAYARIRVRPYRSAPNALDDCDVASSPFPTVAAKILARCEAAADGKNYADPVQRKEAAVSTSKLYALLTAEEKKAVREKCSSFPQFIRLHGQVLLVSPDSMCVWLFKPEHEKCAETVLDARLQYGAGGEAGLAADDPVVRIPERMPDGNTADAAVRELYDALPLTQCVPLDELLLLVPTHVSAALPESREEIAELLGRHPQSFQLWRFADDPSQTIVMRAQVMVPDLDHAVLAKAVLPLIPTQGGTEMMSLLRKAPPHLQRYLYRYGVRATLEKLHAHVAISGARVIRFERHP